MRIAIIGASGFVGQALTRHLLETTTYQLVAFCRSANTLDFGPAGRDRVTYEPGSVFDELALQKALQGADVAVYLLHMMDNIDDDFVKMEAEGAEVFAKVALQTGLPRVVYMGGLGDDHDKLSAHLASRHRTGEILRKTLPLVIELRASMIIGTGSVAYEIIKAIAKKLPIVAVPRWAITRTQPIGLQDALAYLTAALTIPTTQHQIVEIGGPEIVTYTELLERYTTWTGRHEHVFCLPFVPRIAAIWWLSHFVSDKDSAIGKPMVDSLHNEMIVTNDNAKRLFPSIHPQPIEAAFT